MKRLLTLLVLLAFTNQLILAQSAKYVLVELFTNTYCGVCAATNPGYFSRIAVETNPKIHHISYHISVPYQQCPLYQANKPDQDARMNYYSIPGTPRVSVNGVAAVSGGNINNATIETAATGTSPLEVRVFETTGTNRTVNVRTKATGTIATGNYRLHVAVIEKRLNFNAANGEAVHHGVFRKFLSASAGDPLTGFTTTSNVEKTYTYAVDATWNAAQTYIVAWVQNETTKTVLNSGSRFAPLTATQENTIDAQVILAPNPTNGKITVSFTEVTPQYLNLQNVNGQVLEHRKLNSADNTVVDLTNFPSGIYFLKVQSAEGVAVKRFVKQ